MVYTDRPKYTPVNVAHYIFAAIVGGIIGQVAYDLLHKYTQLRRVVPPA